METAFLFVKEYGLLTAVVVYLVVKFVPLALEKIWPEWMASIREQIKAKSEAEMSGRAELMKIYERLITSLEMNARFVSNAALTLNGMERAIDANTRQVAEITEIVRRGPDCPLPGCPFMGERKGESQ